MGGIQTKNRRGRVEVWSILRERSRDIQRQGNISKVRELTYVERSTTGDQRKKGDAGCTIKKKRR